MLRATSHLASYLFLPLFMPLLALYVVVKVDPFLRYFLAPSQAQILFVVVMLSTVVFPLINLFILRKSGIITSYGLVNRHERLAPAVSTAVYFALGYFLIRKGALPTVIYSLYLGAMVSVVLALIVTLKWKISMHAMGIGGVLGGLIGVFFLHDFVDFPAMIAVILAGGWVMTARLALEVHTPAQVYIGYATGFIVTWLSVVNGWNI